MKKPTWKIHKQQRERERKTRLAFHQAMKIFVQSPSENTMQALDRAWMECECSERLTCHPKQFKSWCSGCPFTPSWAKPRESFDCYWGDGHPKLSGAAEVAFFHEKAVEYLALL